MAGLFKAALSTVLGIVLWCGLTSCGGSMLGGAGGSGGRGGMNAAGGMGGSGGNAIPTPPSCLAQLFAVCPIDGACVSHAGDAGVPDRYCFASGTRAEYTQKSSCQGQPTDVMTVTKPDGTLSFTVTTNWLGCEVGNYTWRNAAEIVVATGSTQGFGTGGIGGPGVQCAQTGETATCTYDQGCPVVGLWFANPTCPNGTCQ